MDPKKEGEKPPEQENIETTPDPTPEAEDELVKLIKENPTKTAEEIRQLRKEAADNRKKAQKAEDDRKAAEEAKLKEQGEYKTLAEQREKEIEQLRAQVKQDKINSATTLEAARARIKDPADALKLADLSKVDVSETGVVSGVQEAIADLVKAKPYLVADESPSGGTEKPTPAAPPIKPTNPGGGPKLTPDGLRQLSASDIAAMSPEDFAAAMKALQG